MRGPTPRESNGVILGVNLQPDYPVRNLRIYPGDRFLLYTDGVIEPENAKGTPFGNGKLEQVVLDAQTCSPFALTDKLLSEIRAWQPPSMAHQDDITLIVIDMISVSENAHQGTMRKGDSGCTVGNPELVKVQTR